MTRTFIRGALQGFIFGPLSALLLWTLLSAAISITVLLVSIFLTWNGTTLTLDAIVNWDTSTLTSLPYFSLLDYVQIMWAGLLVPILIAGGMYVIVLAQGTRTERQIVDYFQDVVRDILLFTAFVTIIWLLAGAWWGFQHDSALLHDSSTTLGQTWTNIENESMEGLKAIGLYNIRLDWETVMNHIFPYLPIPFYLLAYFWLFSNIHAGWIGNVWGGS